MTFFLLGSEECFNYSKLSKWWQYLRSSAGRLGNFVAVQVCLRARSFTVYLAIPPSGEVAGRYGSRCACSCCSCGEHSDVGPGRAGTWFSREKEHSMGMASQPISNAFIKVPPHPPPRGALHNDDGEKRTAAPWQNSDPYTLFGVGLGTVTSHETWIQNGPQTSYGEPTDAKNFLNCSIKHCFICAPNTEKWDGASHSRNENPDSHTEPLRHTGRPLKTTEELLVHRNTHRFMKTHWFGEKMQLGNKRYTTKILCHAGHWPRCCLGCVGWRMWGQPSLAGTLTQNFLSRVLESPRPVLWKGEKKNRFKECQKLKKYKVKQIPALLHHCHKRIETEKKKNRKEKNRRIEKRRGRGSDSNPWNKSQAS